MNADPVCKRRLHGRSVCLVSLLLGARLLFPQLIEAAGTVGLKQVPRNQAGVDPVYRLGAADVLTITVYDHLDLSGDYTIYADGIVVLPLLGHVRLSGLSALQGAELIRSRLEEDYLHEPVVGLTVKEHRSRKVTIVGGIGKPGSIYLDGPQRLLDILIEADGLALDHPGTAGQVRIARRVSSASAGAARHPDAGLDTILVDLPDLLAGNRPETNVPVRDGDVIYVPQVTVKVHVVGEVHQPGSFAYEEEMTVLKLITLAGGATKKAALKQIHGLRVRDREVVEVALTLADPVAPDDIIEVRTTFW